MLPDPRGDVGRYGEIRGDLEVSGLPAGSPPSPPAWPQAPPRRSARTARRPGGEGEAAVRREAAGRGGGRWRAGRKEYQIFLNNLITYISIFKNYLIISYSTFEVPELELFSNIMINQQ